MLQCFYDTPLSLMAEMSTNTAQTSDYWSCPTTSVFSGLLTLDLSLSVQARCYDAMDDGSRYSDSHKYCGFPLGWLLELSCHLLPTLSSLTWCAMAWECSIGLPWGESFPCRKQMAPSRILCPGSYFTAHPRATWSRSSDPPLYWHTVVSPSCWLESLFPAKRQCQVLGILVPHYAQLLEANS